MDDSAGRQERDGHRSGDRPTENTAAAEATRPRGGRHDHLNGAEHPTEMSDADCTTACIDKSAKYLFVNEGKSFSISNQDFVDLPKHAGHKVKLTGEITGATIRVTKIEMPAKT